MKVKFFFNWTQEYEGGEIIHFPYLNITQKIEIGEEKYWSVAANFIGSMVTTDSVYRILNIINLYKLENMMWRVELVNLTDSAKAIIQQDNIIFKERFGDSYYDELNLDSFVEILNKWLDYLQTVDKKEIEFEVN